MALSKELQKVSITRQLTRLITLGSVSLMLGACAQSSGIMGLPDLLSSNPSTASYQGGASPIQDNRSELEKATAYWGKQYAKNPQDLNSALSYAKNLKALKQKRQALAVLQNVSRYHGHSRDFASEYGRLALDLDQISVAEKLLKFADDPGRPDWRVISARGTIHAKRGQYGEAIPLYERALALAPGHPSLLSNLAVAYMMKGQPEKAEPLLRQASATKGSSERVRQNLALVLGLQGKYKESAQIAAKDKSSAPTPQTAQATHQPSNLKPNTSGSSDLPLKPTNNWQAQANSNHVATNTESQQ